MQPPLTIADLLPPAGLARVRTAHLFDTIDSTNTFLLDHAADLPDGTLALAEVQTAGRGRQGRAWHAAHGSSLLLSVLAHEPAHSLLLSHAAMLGALAAAEAVESVTSIAPDIRWPNDLCLTSRKLAGVLAQSTSLWCGGGRGVVIGIGINIHQQPGEFPPELAEKATSLAISGAQLTPATRSAVAAALVRRLDHWLAATRDSADSWPQLRAAWRIRCRDIGSRVTLMHDGRAHQGVIADITDDGDLIVDLLSGERRTFGASTTTRSW